MREHLTKHYIEVLQTTSNPKHRLDAMMMLYLINDDVIPYQKQFRLQKVLAQSLLS
jgi:hypothetical protein